MSDPLTTKQVFESLTYKVIEYLSCHTGLYILALSAACVALSFVCATYEDRLTRLEKELLEQKRRNERSETLFANHHGAIYALSSCASVRLIKDGLTSMPEFYVKMKLDQAKIAHPLITEFLTCNDPPTPIVMPS